MNSEENINTIINSVLRGVVSWRDVKTLFVRQEKSIKKREKEYVTVIFIDDPDRNVIKGIGNLGLGIRKNDIVKINRDTYLKLREINIVKEVNISK